VPIDEEKEAAREQKGVNSARRQRKRCRTGTNSDHNVTAFENKYGQLQFKDVALFLRY
jgi:hypothetical protein